MAGLKTSVRRRIEIESNPADGYSGTTKLIEKQTLHMVRYRTDPWCWFSYGRVAESTDNELAVVVLKDIANEEFVHASEFLRLLQELAPDKAKLYAPGAKEVEEKIAMN